MGNAEEGEFSPTSQLIGRSNFIPQTPPTGLSAVTPKWGFIGPLQLLIEPSIDSKL